jgi:hypothetical protein
MCEKKIFTPQPVLIMVWKLASIEGIKWFNGIEIPEEKFEGKSKLDPFKPYILEKLKNSA